MKRSEMIEAVTTSLAEYIGIPKTDTQKELATFILLTLEHKGMLPPEIDIIIEGHICTVNEWEKE